MGHRNVNDVLQIEKVAEGRKITAERWLIVSLVSNAKWYLDVNTTQPFEFVHCDLSGSFSHIAREGHRVM